MHKLTLLALLTLAGCGGGGGGASVAPTPTAKSIGGIWETTYTVPSGPTAGNTINGVAIAAENGHFFVLTQYINTGCASVGFGHGSTTGSALNGTMEWALVQYTTIPGINVNCVASDGASAGYSSITGSVVERASLSLTTIDTTSLGTVLPAVTTAWSYNVAYTQPASFATIAGNYADGAATLSISSSGAIFEQDAVTGCVVNGQVSIPDPAWNAYEFSITYSNCTGAYALMNGVRATGLGAYDDASAPAQLLGGWTATVNGTRFVVVAVLVRQ